MTHFGELISTLANVSVDFVVIGGVALVGRGGSRATNDLDIVYSREKDNLERLVSALAPTHPRPQQVVRKTCSTSR